MSKETQNIMDQWEREEDQVEKDYANGYISLQERNKHLLEIQRDYRDSARQAAHDAYERELDNW